jgi:hypothetical protein
VKLSLKPIFGSERNGKKTLPHRVIVVETVGAVFAPLARSRPDRIILLEFHLRQTAGKSRVWGAARADSRLIETSLNILS